MNEFFECEFKDECEEYNEKNILCRNDISKKLKFACTEYHYKKAKV